MPDYSAVHPSGALKRYCSSGMTRRCNRLYLAIGLPLLLLGCGLKPKPPSLPEGVTVESQIPRGISWASLLLQASDLNSLTTEPPPGEQSVLFSSSAETQKVSLAHLAPEVLGDLDHGFFLRVDDAEGGVEAILAEAVGAGAITWIWSANPVGTAVLYIDNEQTPAIEMPFADLLAGAFLPVQRPFASFTAHGHNLHFPFVHTNSLRLAIRVSERKQLSELFYHVAWNAFDPRQPIHPFDLASMHASGPLLGSLAQRYAEPLVNTNGATRMVETLVLDPGESRTVFKSDDFGVLRVLEITAASKAALSELWIDARWDHHSKPAVSSPLSMLAGVSPRFEDTQSLPCTVAGRRVTLRWPMPFGPGSTISCVSKGSRPHVIEVGLLVDEQPGERATQLLRFQANYRRQVLSLTTRNVVNLGVITGPGRIVGCTLRVDSRSSGWWGEGDEIVWLDHDDKAAWRGTGTEDYFGFAWCSDQVFHHPLRGQTRADGSRSSRRVAAMHRYHLLDRLPFHRYARFEMEAWGLADGFMDYETTLLWFAPLPWEWDMEPERDGTDI